VISTEQMDLALVQIASRLVRRIVCYVKEGEVVERSERIGMIKFGSQVDVFLPTRVCPRLEVEIGQRLTAGETPISRIVSPGVGIEVP
jgi:phosphatidylserine decarboxylase